MIKIHIFLCFVFYVVSSICWVSASVLESNSKTGFCAANILGERFEGLSTEISRRNKISSCFRFDSIDTFNLNEYQLVSFSKSYNAMGVSNDVIVSTLPAFGVKSYLKNKSLLILGDKFSLSRLSYACAYLQQSGFMSIRLGLIKSLPIGSSVAGPKKYKQVSAVDFIYEYSNHGVIVVAEPSQSTKLKNVGVRVDFIVPNGESLNIGLIKSKFGYSPNLPVVRFGKPTSAASSFYAVSGGVDAVIRYLTFNKLLSQHHSTLSYRSACPNA